MITDKDGKKKTYTYDRLSQLIREDDENAGTTILYTYDGGGNLCTVTTYAYTTEEPAGTPLSTETYAYDSVWKDKLVSYNGQTIEYDAIGNPLIYLDHSFEWQDGRTLKKITEMEAPSPTHTQ